MINLNERELKSNRSLIKRLKAIVEPKTHLAKNVADYVESSKMLRPPWYERGLLGWRTYVVLEDVGIYRVKMEGERHEEEIHTEWFRIHDSSGDALVFWPNVIDQIVFPEAENFEESKRRQGLKDDDWVSYVILQHSSEAVPHIPHIIRVEKERAYSRKGLQ